MSVEAAAWEIFRRRTVIPALCEQAKMQGWAIDVQKDDAAQLLAIGNDLPHFKANQALLASFATLAWPALNISEKVINTLLPPQHGCRPSSVGVLNFTTGSEREQSIEQAAQSSKQGKLVLVVDPCAHGIGAKVEAFATMWRTLCGKPQTNYGRARVDTWLAMIADFESAELNRPAGQKRGDQLFARYRRIIDRWEWPS